MEGLIYNYSKGEETNKQSNGQLTNNKLIKHLLDQTKSIQKGNANNLTRHFAPNCFMEGGVLRLTTMN